MLNHVSFIRGRIDSEAVRRAARPRNAGCRSDTCGTGVVSRGPTTVAIPMDVVGLIIVMFNSSGAHGKFLIETGFKLNVQVDDELRN